MAFARATAPLRYHRSAIHTFCFNLCTHSRSFDPSLKMPMIDHKPWHIPLTTTTLLEELIDVHGPVRYIVLPSVAVEHKVVYGFTFNLAIAFAFTKAAVVTLTLTQPRHFCELPTPMKSPSLITFTCHPDRRPRVRFSPALSREHTQTLSFTPLTNSTRSRCHCPRFSWAYLAGPNRCQRAARALAEPRCGLVSSSMRCSA